MKFDEGGDPVGVERLGIALEPEADYERRPDGGGGCEDPRITFLEDLGRYVMTYTAFSPSGPRIALALSEDLFHWRRWGWRPSARTKGSSSRAWTTQGCQHLPRRHPQIHEGQPAMAILHRPLFPGTRPEDKGPRRGVPQFVDLHRESIWVSYCPLDTPGDGPYYLRDFALHNRLASPVAAWEELKIGGGTPPIRTRHGWLVIYHGVRELAESSPGAQVVLLGRRSGALRRASARSAIVRRSRC